jgi:glutathione S-transferase
MRPSPLVALVVSAIIAALDDERVNSSRLSGAAPGRCGAMIELYQAEWCPHSHRVRQRLTELGVSFVARQVPAEQADREELRRKTGSDEIPALVDDEQVIAGDDDALIAYLDRTYNERADADEHRRQAELHERAA